jgi:hypothetical protein
MLNKLMLLQEMIFLVTLIEVTVPKLILGVTRTWFVWQDRISIGGELNFINTFDGKRNTVVKTKAWSMEPALGLEVGYK